MERIASVFRPNYTWPRPITASILETTPPTPSVSGQLQRRLWGLVHSALYHVSCWYSRWYGITSDAGISQLPFGLILKWSQRTSKEEAAAMQMARAAGMPVPLVLSCGEHPDHRLGCFFSILMTRLPGFPLQNSADPLDIESEDPWLYELRDCVVAMRKWKSPYSERICSAIGTQLRSIRVPGHVMGPFSNSTELHDFLISPASKHGFSVIEKYEEALSKANEIREYSHRITFTHGDFQAHNILVGDDGHLSGFLDWESAGWMPEYWDFTTAMRFGSTGWWFQAASWMGGDKYASELQSDKALNSLTVDSYVGL